MSITIPDFSKAKVLVVGDVMLDRYWHGPIKRISPEAPVPILKVEHQEECPGGAANVALNIATLGASVSLFGVVGQDAAGTCLIEKLTAEGVKSFLIQQAHFNTIVKLRVLGQHQQIIRLDFEDEQVPTDFSELLGLYEQALASTDVVILSDYAKGVLQIAPELIRLARAHGKAVFVDPKRADFSDYRGASVITPNYKEFEAVVGPCHSEDEIIEKGMRLVEELQLAALLITRSEDGMTLLQANKKPHYLKAFEQEVFDVTGAGDTVIATLASAIAAGLSYAKATELANLAAAISVKKRNAATVTIPELRRALWTMTPHLDKHVLSQSELLTSVMDAKAQGETIVMTNGCFDLLHPGHIHYLEEARSLGDRLIVAVNDDASVQALKGLSRPINPLAARMSVLAGLRSVDWVVPFSEETPERLISEVLPDVLVKGGDYSITQIAGHQAVLANGGSVKILSFVDGFSTTSMIDKMHCENFS